MPAQVVFEMEHLPFSTPEKAPLYITGTFNDWNPRDDIYLLKKNAQGRLQVSVAASKIPFEYKFTRGSWSTVEGDSLGNANKNRIVEEMPSAPIQVYIDSWEDQPPQPPKAYLRVVVGSIPDNTPPDAPIYAVGNFNSWHPGDTAFKLEPQENGSHVIDLPIYGDKLEFKFTRGNWETVEGRQSGRARYNRVFNYVEGKESIVRTEIETWEDLSGSAFNVFTVLWLLAAILGILLVVAILTLQNNNVEANRILAMLLVLISVTLLGRVAVYDREVFQTVPKLLLVQDLMLFLYAPIFLMYIRKLLHGERFSLRSRFWLHLIPFGLHWVAYSPMIFLEKYTFISLNVDLGLFSNFAAAGGVALIYNVIYWFHIRSLIRRYQKSAEDTLAHGPNLSFLNVVMKVKAVCLVIWFLVYVVGGVDMLVAADLENIMYRGLDVLYLAFSLTVFFLSYFAIREPEIFKIPVLEEVEEEIPEEPETEAEGETPMDWTSEKTALSHLMQSEEPFLNPKLTLAQLAELSGTNVHGLSRLINEGFGVNFNDYVNSFRVEAFKSAAQEEKYQNHTFLAIALMVGFNSKTAFNRSFKKLTGMTPREWMKSEQEEKVLES